MANPPTNDDISDDNQGRFSLHGLSAAFARLTGASDAKPSTPKVAETPEELGDSSQAFGDDVLSPRMIVEGMLFVGGNAGEPLSSREMAAHIRDVSPREVESLMDDLNALYSKSHSAYRIASEGKGFRLVLAEQYDSLRRRFYGGSREAKLTPTAIEVLSVVAYRQPINAQEIMQLRGGRCHAVLSQLVRRGLLRLDRPESSPRQPVYLTTDRFNTLFQIKSPKELPSSEDLDDC